jgi:AcrR family transcriptional regulator
MSFVAKQDWLMAGINILIENGVNALTIEALTIRLGVTKGSFYHHFKNYQDFKAALLDYYEERGTLQIIEMVETKRSPAEKLAELMDLTMSGPPEIEVIVRAWALQDKFVQTYQQRIDTERIDYLQKLCSELAKSETQAIVMAQMIYAVYIGSQNIVPPISNENLKQIYDEIRRVFFGEQ